MRHSFIAAILIAMAVALAAIITGWTRGAMPFQPGARYSDAVTSHYPSAQYFADSINEAGEFPVWRQTIMGGQPFAANPLNKTAYPFTWLAVVLPILSFFDVMIAVHLLVAALGMYAWARQHDLRWEAACLSTAAYVLAPRLFGHLAAGHLDLVYALAWFPWLMVSVTAALRTQRMARWLLAGMAAALVLLADVRFAFYAYTFCAAYTFYKTYRQPLSRRTLAGVVAAVFVVVAATSAVTLPLIGWSPFLTRAGLTVQDAAVFSLEPTNLLSLLLAPGGNVETLLYLGVPVMMLASMAIAAQPRRHLFFLLVIFFALVWAFGPNAGLWTVLAEVFTPLRWFRVPSRALLIVVPVIALLAGFGLQLLLDGFPLGYRSLRRARLVVFAVTAICALLGGLMFLVGRLDAQTTIILAVTGTGAGIVLLIAMRIRRYAVSLLLCLFGLVAVDHLSFAQRWLEWRHIDEWFMPHAVLAQRLLELEPDRLYSPTYSVPQFVAEYDYFELFSGVDPFQIAAVSDAILAASGVESSGYSVVMPPLTGIRGDAVETANAGAIPDTEILAQWGVSHVVAAYELDVASLALIGGVDGQFIYANRDYEADWQRDPLTGWPANWVGLPASETVQHLNELTLSGMFISVVTWITVTITVVILILRDGRNRAEHV